MLELILENQLILISLVVSFTPIVLSLILFVGFLISRNVSQRRQRKLELEHRQRMIKAKKAKARRLAMQAKLQAEQALEPASEAVSSEDATEETEEESEANGEIQDILTSVFLEEEGDGKYAVLLKDYTPIKINELAGFASNVLEQLRIRSQGIA